MPAIETPKEKDSGTSLFQFISGGGDTACSSS